MSYSHSSGRESGCGSETGPPIPFTSSSLLKRRTVPTAKGSSRRLEDQLCRGDLYTPGKTRNAASGIKGRRSLLLSMQTTHETKGVLATHTGGEQRASQELYSTRFSCEVQSRTFNAPRGEATRIHVRCTREHHERRAGLTPQSNRLSAIELHTSHGNRLKVRFLAAAAGAPLSYPCSVVQRTIEDGDDLLKRSPLIRWKRTFWPKQACTWITAVE